MTSYHKYLISAGVLVIAFSLFFLLIRSGNQQAAPAKLKTHNATTSNLTPPPPSTESDSTQLWFQQESEMERKMFELMEYRDQERFETAYLEWLEENEAEALLAAEAFGRFFPTYNLSREQLADTVIGYLMQKYGGQGTVEALDVVDADGSMGREFYESLTVAWIDESPEAFRQWFRETPILNNPDARNRLMTHEFQHPDLDPVESIQFYEGMVETDPRKKESLLMAYAMMVDYQPEAANTYLSASEPTPEMADGFTRLARDASQSGDIEQVLQWTDKIIDDHGLRYQMTVSILAQLGHKDPDKVEAWASTTSFFDGWPQQDIDQWMNDLNDTIQNIDDVPSAPEEIGRER